MGVNSLPKTVTRQCRGCDLNPALVRLSLARRPIQNLKFVASAVPEILYGV